MKRCSYCGREYPDDASMCAVDHQPLVPVGVPPVAPGIGQSYGSRKLLSYIAPLRAGVVLAIMYGLLGLIFLPFFVVGALIEAKTRGSASAAAFGGLLLAIFFPILYALAGFIGGLIAAAIYNLIARWTGGFEFEFRDAQPRAS